MPRKAPEPKIPTLTVKDVALILRKSERFVLDEARSGKLRGAQIGREWLFRPLWVDAYIDSRTNMPAEAAAV